MKIRSLHFVYIVCIAVPMLIATAQDINKEIKRTAEKNVDLKLESAFGSLNVAKGESNKVVSVYYSSDKKGKKPKLDIRYKASGENGDLQIGLTPEKSEKKEDGSVSVNAGDFNFEYDVWYIKLSNEIRYDVDAELGAGKSVFNFSGIPISNLSVQSGASSTKIIFDEPNKTEIKNFKIETGVSKFSGENLGNANFRRMKFSGGVGSYYLNFGGKLKNEADVDIEVGLGSITIVVPKNIGAMIKYEDNWLSNIKLGDGFKMQRKGVYKTENYNETEGKLNIYVEASLGSVKVRRED